MPNLAKIILSASCLIPTQSLLAAPRTISTDKALTSTSKLSNGIPLISRETPGSEIAHFEVNFSDGTSQAAPNTRAINLMALEAMPFATKKFPKNKIFALSEKFSFAIACKGGVEISHCQVETIKDYLPQAVDLLAEVILNPSFENDDVELARKHRIADFQRDTESPEARVNAVVNKVFYDPTHPFRLLPEDGIEQAKKITRAEIIEYHKSLVDAGRMSVIYAGPKLPAPILKKLNDTLGKIKNQKRVKSLVPMPVYDTNNDFAIEHRDIPTAYIRLKFNAPAASSPDSEAAEVLFEILSEKLHEEVRTKRSLSYAVHAGNIAYSQGIGMIGASTSKPKETLETIAMVIRDLREKTISQEELSEYRNTFTTSYYLTMETHDSLAAALGGAHEYYGDAFRMYEVPAKLSAVTPADIKRVAQSVLTKFRFGVVYDKEKFKTSWLDPVRSL
jgi:zinc protease